MQWQHGTYVIYSNGSVVLTPFAVDGRQLLSEPCASDASVYTRYNQTETFEVLTIHCTLLDPTPFTLTLALASSFCQVLTVIPATALRSPRRPLPQHPTPKHLRVRRHTNGPHVPGLLASTNASYNHPEPHRHSRWRHHHFQRQEQEGPSRFGTGQGGPSQLQGRRHCAQTEPKHQP